MNIMIFLVVIIFMILAVGAVVIGVTMDKKKEEEGRDRTKE